jgi:uncharacterized membrane protein (UPF0182 family)
VSSTSWTYLIAAVVGVTCISLWAWLILVPAWSSFSRVWERLLATVMSIYILAALVALGGGLAAGVLFYYGEIG